MNLKETLIKPKGTTSISKYFQSLCNIYDELALISCPIRDDDLVIHVLHGVNLEFKEIAVVIRARESYISFEELLEKLIDYKQVMQLHSSQIDIVVSSAHYVVRPSSYPDEFKHKRFFHALVNIVTRLAIQLSNATKSNQKIQT